MPIKYKPTFINTKNVRNFTVMMDGLQLGIGEGRLGLVYGVSGLGKTRTSQWYAAHNQCIYIRMMKVWRTSEFEFLRAIYRELGLTSPPKRKSELFNEVSDRLSTNPVPVFIDEVEKLPDYFQDVIRDLSDITTAPFILIGELGIVPYMKRNNRVWMRTFQECKFEPLTASDVAMVAKETCKLTVKPEVADALFISCNGNFRALRRDLLKAIQVMNARGLEELTVEVVKAIR